MIGGGYLILEKNFISILSFKAVRFWEILWNHFIKAKLYSSWNFKSQNKNAFFTKKWFKYKNV